MPRLRPVSLGGLPWLELVRLSGDDGWHYGVLNGRKEIGRLTHLPGVDPGGPWRWAVRWGPHGHERTRAKALQALARAWSGATIR
jgi:hypothetical protein